MIKEFCNWIAVQLDLTIDAMLFAGWRPEDAPDTCSVLLERSSAHTATDGTELTWAPIQIISRGASYFTARDTAESIADLLINLCGVSLTGYVINTITGARPAYLGQDVRGRHEFSTNIVVRYRTKEA